MLFKLSVYSFVEMLNDIAEILVVAFFYHRILDKKYDSFVPYIISYLAAFMVLMASSLIVSSPYVRICVSIAILFSISFVVYGGSKITRFFASIYFLLVMYISETLFAGILSVMEYGNPTELLESNIGRVLGMVGTKIFDFWIVVYSCRVYKKKVKSLPLKYWILIILMPFLSAIILFQIFPAYNADDNVLIWYIVCVCGVLYLNFSVFNYFESYDNQIRLASLEQIMEREKENYRMINDSYTEIKNLKHDLKNQVSVLNDLIGNERFEEAKVYMGRLYKDVEQTTSVCYTGNPVVDSIINLKGDYAKSRGINFITKINTNTIEFDAIALCRILGNALDNSIEACEQVENGEKYIYIAINQINNKLIIEIENTSLPVDVSNLTTTKADKKLHGIGMQSIKQSAESMNGCVSCNYENGYFSIKIILTE